MNGKKKDLGGTQAQIRQNNLNKLGFDLSKFDYHDKDKLLRNCVHPEIGLKILNRALEIVEDNKSNQLQLL
jgi:hypothetical protein